MNNNNFRKALNYFAAKHGDAYNDSSKIFDFGWSNLPRIVQYAPELSSDAKICITVLIDLKHNNNSPNPQLFYPSQKRIAFLSGLSVSAVSRAFSKLEEVGLVGKMRLGQGKQNIYCLLKPPDVFVLNAIKRRSIVELIRQGRLDWADVDEKGEVIIEDENEKKIAETLINTLICKYANQEFHPCKSEFPNQGSPDGLASAPTLDLGDSELSSVELSSDESSSSNGFSENSEVTEKQQADDDCGKTVENLTTLGDDYYLAIEQKMADLGIRVSLSSVDSQSMAKVKKAGVAIDLVLVTMDEVFANNRMSNNSKNIRSFGYFVPAIMEAHEAKSKIVKKASSERERMKKRLEEIRKEIDYDG